MISIRKLKTLPRLTRLRKLVLLLQAEELELARGRDAHGEYLRALAGILREEEKAGEEVRQAAASLSEHLAEPGAGRAQLRRQTNRLRHALLRRLGAEPAEWDLLEPLSEELDPSARTVLPICVYLEEIRSPFNVGAMFRTSEAFGVERILLSPTTASPLHPRALKSARGAVAVMPWQFAGLSELKEREGVFALELDGTPLDEFRFPERGVMLVGSEELGLSPESLALAAAGAGRVSVRMAGAKRSLNVAVAFGIVLRAWFRQLGGGETDRTPG